MGLQTTTMKRSKKAKLNARIGSEAMNLAKKNHDKMAVKAERYKRLWMSLKEKIIRKYRQKARAKVYSHKKK